MAGKKKKSWVSGSVVEMLILPWTSILNLHSWTPWLSICFILHLHRLFFQINSHSGTFGCDHLPLFASGKVVNPFDFCSNFPGEARFVLWQTLINGARFQKPSVLRIRQVCHLLIKKGGGGDLHRKSEPLICGRASFVLPKDDRS